MPQSDRLIISWVKDGNDFYRITTYSLHPFRPTIIVGSNKTNYFWRYQAKRLWSLDDVKSDFFNFRVLIEKWVISYLNIISLAGEPVGQVGDNRRKLSLQKHPLWILLFWAIPYCHNWTSSISTIGPPGFGWSNHGNYIILLIKNIAIESILIILILVVFILLSRSWNWELRQDGFYIIDQSYTTFTFSMILRFNAFYLVEICKISSEIGDHSGRLPVQIG